MTELKPCPFCGGTGERWNVVSTSKKRPLSWVKCKLCGATTASYGTEEQAVNAWNRRTHDKS
jgi:Lar family restriction alleviation protein|nr:MAG TPA: restriction alleviation protein [Caudoviricetes sp.]